MANIKRYIINRMKKHLHLNNIFISQQPKYNDVIKKYFQLVYNSVPTDLKRSAKSEYQNPKSPIFRGLKMKVVPLSPRKLEQRRLKKLTKAEKIQYYIDITLPRRKLYLDYLKSDEWKNFKNKLKKLRGNKCEICSITGITLDGHHLTYERLCKEKDDDVQLLCRNCHQKVHGKNFITGKKLKIFKSINTNK